MESVKVTEIRRTPKPGPLWAFADVKMGTVLIQDFHRRAGEIQRP